MAETAITTGNLTRSVAQQAQITVAFIDSILIGIVERVQAEAVAPWPESGLHELGGLHELLAKRAA